MRWSERSNHEELVSQPAGLLVQRIADNSPAAAIRLIGGTYKAAIAGGEMQVGGDIILAVGEIAVTPDGAGLDEGLGPLK